MTHRTESPSSAYTAALRLKETRAERGHPRSVRSRRTARSLPAPSLPAPSLPDLSLPARAIPARSLPALTLPVVTLPALALAAAVALPAANLPANAQTPSLDQAFQQGGQFGRSGNSGARKAVTDGDATRLPGYSANPTQASHFGSASLSDAASSALAACAAAASGAQSDGQSDAACTATTFTQNNPSRRGHFTIDPEGALLSRGRAIAADPASIAGNIAGNIAGTYGDCSVITTEGSDRFETQICHAWRLTETHQCDKTLVVTTQRIPSCPLGTLLSRVVMDPCPSCFFILYFDFTCASGGYTMNVYTGNRSTGALMTSFGSKTVPGSPGDQIAKTQGPSQRSGSWCYDTWYSQSCSGTACTMTTWFDNPCTRQYWQASGTFEAATSVSLRERWDDQCTALQARSQ